MRRCRGYFACRLTVDGTTCEHEVSNKTAYKTAQARVVHSWPAFVLDTGASPCAPVFALCAPPCVLAAALLAVVSFERSNAVLLSLRAVRMVTSIVDAAY